MYRSEELSQYVVRTSFGDLPADVITKAKDCIVDSVGCAVGASQTEVGRIVLDVAESIGGNAEATLMGRRARAAAAVAAFANSELANKMDYDDIMPGHVGAMVVPPAVAVAEKLRSSGKELITSVVLGYEVCCRVVASLQEEWPIQQKKVYGLGTWEVFGAATVAGKLLRLNEEQMTHAIVVAGCNAPVPSLGKSWAGGLALQANSRCTSVKNNYGAGSWAGVTSAMLAQKGFRGPRDLFEGETGFWRWTGAIGYDNSRLTAELGQRYGIRSVNFKSYPCGGPIHPAVAASLGITQKNKIRPEEIDEIKIWTTDLCTMPMSRIVDVEDMQDALFSWPWSVAAAIAGAAYGPHYYEESLKDPRVRTLAEKIHLYPEVRSETAATPRAAEEARPIPPTSALVELVARGKKFTNRAEMHWGRAYTNYPDARKKFALLASPVIGAAKAGKLFESLANLEDCDNIRKITRLLR